jgi:hypothetical protein
VSEFAASAENRALLRCSLREADERENTATCVSFFARVPRVERVHRRFPLALLLLSPEVSVTRS